MEAREGSKPKAETHNGSVHESPTGAAGRAMCFEQIWTYGFKSHSGTVRSKIVMMFSVLLAPLLRV
jgi:hypothetical protein